MILSNSFIGATRFNRMQDVSRDYAVKQKTPQIVYVRGKENPVNVSLANLAKNFDNIPQSNDEVMFQVKSTRFPHQLFNTLFAGDYIEISFDVVFDYIVPGETEYFARYYATDSTYNDQQFVRIDFNNDNRIATAAEVIYYLNQALLLKLNSYGPRDTSPGVRADGYFSELLGFFITRCKFVLAQGKLSIVYNATNLTQSALTEYGDLIVREMRVHIRPGRSLSEIRQEQLARLLGMPVQQNPYFFSVSTDSLYRQEINVKMWEVLDVLGTPVFPDMLNLYDNDTYYYSQGLMNVNTHQSIYIFSTLNTSYWSSSGRRLQLLRVVHMDQDITQTAEETFDSSKSYFMTDSLSSLRNFELSFKDEYGNDIIFDGHEEYEIEVAIFFKDELVNA